MKVNVETVKKKEKEFTIMIMVLYMKVIIGMVIRKVKELYIEIIGIIMKVNRKKKNFLFC